MFANVPQPSSTGPSLFTNNLTTTSAQSGASLFGTAATSSTSNSTQPAPSNLFASAASGTSQAQNPGSLFGGLGSAAISQPAQAQSTSAPSGLFGSLGASTTKPQGTGTTASLFSGLGTSTQAPQQPTTTGSLFGGLGTATTQPHQTTSTGSLFAGLGGQTQPTSNPASSSYGHSVASTNQAQQGQVHQQGGPLAHSTSATGRSAHFDHLLERGRKRNNQENGVSQFGDLPALQLGLGDIARKVRNIGTGGPSASQVHDSNVHYLLAASGVPTGSTFRDLNQFSAQAGLSTVGPAPHALDTDIDSYIATLHAQSTLSLIQEGLEQSKRDFDLYLEEKVQMEWDAQRRRIYEHFGLAKQSEKLATTSGPALSTSARGAFGRSARRGRAMGTTKTSSNGMSFGASGTRSVLGSPPSGHSTRAASSQDLAEKPGATAQPVPEDRFLRDKQEKYMDRVKELNISRLKETLYPVLHKFSEVEVQSGIDNTQKLADAYSALVSIVREDAKSEKTPSLPNSIKERHYAKLYLEDTVEMRKRILEGSRGFLEKAYFARLESNLAKNPREANLGGVPSTVNKIRAYIRIKLAFKELCTDNEHVDRLKKDHDDFPWAVVFHLLRSGLINDANEYVTQNSRFFRNHDAYFSTAMAQYAKDPERRLSPDMQRSISGTFAQRNRVANTQNDPYCMACYKIVGRCDLNRRTLDEIPQDMEDWIWLQFALARESNRLEENAGQTFGLGELRATVHDIGQRHFAAGSDAGGGYGVYFYLAILAGMFEEAISYLYRHNYVSAVHFAIALDFYGLLRVSDWYSSGAEIVTYSTQQQMQINFGRMVGLYTSDFRAAKAEAAADYLILICLNADLPGEAGQQQRNLCHGALRELVLETREFAELLGDVRENGTSTPGVIQQRLPLIKLGDQKDYLKTITIQAAKSADDSGRTTDAVLLYHLSGEYDNVVSILNRALSEAISVDLGQEPLRLEPLKPRTLVSDTQQQQMQQTDAVSGPSLSLIAIDDPGQLTQKIIALYKPYQKAISQTNRETVDALLELYRAKKLVETGQWTYAIDAIDRTQILPIQAKGSLQIIRARANNFSVYPPEIARNIGNVLMWTIVCLGRHREHLLSGQFEDANRRGIAETLLQAAKDLMVFAGLIRYKLPPRVFEVLAKAGQDVGIY